MTRPPRIFLYCGALLLMLLLLAFLGSGSRVHDSLQSYKAALRAKGEKLTFAELERCRSTNLTDTLTVLSNAVPAFLGASFNPGDLEVMKYVGPGRVQLAWKRPSPNWTGAASSNSPPGWEAVAEEIASHQAALADIRAALHAPTPNSGPCTNLMTRFGPNFVMLRSAAQWLTASAFNEIHHAHLEPALQDVEALASMAQLDREECTLVAQATRIAVTDLGLENSWQILQAPGWTDSQLARLQKAWEPVRPVEAIEFAFVGERMYGGEIFAMLHKSGWRKAFPYMGVTAPTKGNWQDFLFNYVWFPSYRLTSLDEDELFRLKMSEETLTGLRMVEAHQPWKEAKQHIDQPGVWIRQADTPVGRLRHLGSLSSFPNTQRITTRTVRVETERQLALAAIALKHYQLRHGTLPPSLAALTPEFVSAMPYDPMSGKALCYRLKPDGRFLLYSVGEDGKDDGGDAKPVSGNTYGLWEGRDWVWPEASDANK
ncbi:MAG TPA: hypothetical protein VMU04_02105 [Candidatus Acidoferrum sp.]|nr:hypothetical protein [Candidatus Acidoferrum sp.]